MDLNMVRVDAVAWGPLTTTVAVMLSHPSVRLVLSLFPWLPFLQHLFPNISPRGWSNPLPHHLLLGIFLPPSRVTWLSPQTSACEHEPWSSVPYFMDNLSRFMPFPPASLCPSTCGHSDAPHTMCCHMLLFNISSTLTFPEEQTWVHFLQCCSLSAYNIIWMC